MHLGNVNNLYGLYSNLFQGSMSLYSNKLTKLLKPVNNAHTAGSLNKNSFGYIKNLKSGSSALGDALHELLDDDSWAKNFVSSSDTDVLAVKQNGGGSHKARSSNWSVLVKRTASGQVNDGVSLKSDALFGKSGDNEFTIEYGGKSTNIKINIADIDTYKDVQQKMANALNDADVGIKATVVKDELQGKSTLRLESNETGGNNVFKLSDTSGNAVSITGANNITTMAQDALYSVDGGELQKARNNTIDIGDLTVELKKASDETVTVASEIDSDRVKKLVSDMVSGFNTLFESAAEKAMRDPKDPKAMNLFTRLMTAAKTYSSSLSNIGINFDDNGVMKIDDEKLSEAAENGSLEKFFSENKSKNFGFANKLSSITKSVTYNTTNYISSTITGSLLTENFSYNNHGNILQYKYMTPGLLLDYKF